MGSILPPNPETFPRGLAVDGHANLIIPGQVL